MRVSEALELSISDDGVYVNKLERYPAKEIERFRKQVFGKVLRPQSGCIAQHLHGRTQ